MRSRWFHRPLLHTALHGERKVTWLELFYDLVFVAGAIQLGNALSDDVSVGGAFAFAGHFVPLWIAWTGFTFYANRFLVDDMLHRVLVFVKMFAVGAMAIAAKASMDGDPARFAWAYALAQGIIALLYLRSWHEESEARAYSRYWGIVFAVGAVLFLVSGFVPTPWCYALWGAGVATILFAPVSRQSRALADAFPIDMEHLSERYGLLTIIVLGESFVKVLSYITASYGAEFGVLAKGSLTLLITCAVWWIYFDDVAGSKVREGRGGWIVWLYGHLPLTLGITALAVGVKKAIGFELGEEAPFAYRWLLSSALAVTFLAAAAIDSVTERRQTELSDRVRVNVRIISALLALVAGQVGGGTTAGVYIGIITAICAAQVLFDVMMAPMEDAVLERMHVETTAEIARMRARGELTADGARPATDLEPIRRGTPAELKRDLYFFFLEGSWKRLFATMVVAYLLINIAFAALFLLEPGSIGGGDKDTFATAFFFSVQTMSTIGYGGMSPATPYADVIVTIEAAVGLLSVALATGLIFAKVSRPRSSVLFSRPIVLTTRDGKPTLTFRAGNARGNEVVDASMSLVVMKEELTPEGHHTRRLHDLKLVRDRSPMFTLSWTVMHVIDEQSPLADVDWSQPGEHVVAFIATLMGHDGTYGQTTYARQMYQPSAVRVGHRFVDVIHQLPNGRLLVDYGPFHETVPDHDGAGAG